MFKAVFSNNKYILSKLVEAILDYYKIDIDIRDKEIIIKNSELPIDNYLDRNLICDYIIKLDNYHEINIEINRSRYIGLMERNMTYSFKIFCEHFKVGDKYNKFSDYTLLQVNFNNFSNPNEKNINRYYMIDIDDLENRLSNSYSIMNIDIEKCFKFVYNNSNLEDVSDLEKWAAIIYSDNLMDIASILERGMISMSKESKEKFLNDIKEKATDKDVLDNLKLENTVEDRIKWIEEATREQATKEGVEEGFKHGIEQGIEQGIKQNTIQLIKSMLANGASYEFIEKVTGKSIREIKKIEKSN